MGFFSDSAIGLGTICHSSPVGRDARFKGRSAPAAEPRKTAESVSRTLKEEVHEPEEEDGDDDGDDNTSQISTPDTTLGRRRASSPRFARNLLSSRS